MRAPATCAPERAEIAPLDRRALEPAGFSWRSLAIIVECNKGMIIVECNKASTGQLSKETPARNIRPISKDKQILA